MHKMRIIYCFLVLLSTNTLLGCIPLDQYRKNYTVAKGADIQSNLESAEFNEGKDPYFLGIVEFDDSGLLFDPGQLNFVISKLQSPIEDYDGKIVVVFAHGWNNNAKPDNENLKYLRTILKTIAWYEKENSLHAGRKPRFVEGVYLAWRGKSMYEPFSTLLTFWNRKDTAHTIGDRAATQTLLRLRNAAYSTKSDSDPPNRFIIVGHSFGGALVYSAVSPLLTYQLQQCQSETSAYPPLADSIILVNPAFEASRVLPLYQALNDNLRCSDSPLPKLAIFTSDSDDATKFWFGAARVSSKIFNPIRSSYRQADNPLRQEGYKIDEQDADNRSIGHYDPLVTHFLMPSKNKNLKQDKVDCGLNTDWNNWTPSGLAAQETLNKTYRNQTYNYLDFGETCLVVANPNYFNLIKGFENKLMRLKNQHLAVFNAKVHEEIWDGHGLPKNKDDFLTFLGRFIPFSVGGQQF